MRLRTEILAYNKLNGSISTSSAVSGIPFASQYASAPPSSFVSTERFGDFRRNWNRCSFFKRASGAVAGPRMRTPLSSCGEKYSESCRDQRMAFSKLMSRTITFASEVNGGHAILRPEGNYRSKEATESSLTPSRTAHMSGQNLFNIPPPLHSPPPH